MDAMAGIKERYGALRMRAIGQVRGWLGHAWRYQGNRPYSFNADTSFGDASLVVR